MWGKTFRLHVGMASTREDMAILHTLLRQQDPRNSPSSYILLIQMQSLFVQPHMPPTWKPWQPKEVPAIKSTYQIWIAGTINYAEKRDIMLGAR